MLLNAAIVAVSHLHVKWESERYERSRWMIVGAMIGLAIQYMMQMFFGFRAADDGLGAVINILVYTPCFSLISMGIYNLEAPRISCRKMNRVCGGIYAVILLVFCVSIYLHQSLFIREGPYLMLALFGGSVVYCISMIIREILRRRKMLETMTATDMLPYVRFSHASVFILLLASFIMPVAILSTSLLFIVGPLVLLAVLLFNLTFVALGCSYIPTDELLDTEAESCGVVEMEEMNYGGTEERRILIQNNSCSLFWALVARTMGTMCPKPGLSMPRLWSLDAQALFTECSHLVHRVLRLWSCVMFRFSRCMIISIDCILSALPSPFCPMA